MQDGVFLFTIFKIPSVSSVYGMVLPKFKKGLLPSINALDTFSDIPRPILY